MKKFLSLRKIVSMPFLLLVVFMCIGTLYSCRVHTPIVLSRIDSSQEGETVASPYNIELENKKFDDLIEIIGNGLIRVAHIGLIHQTTLFDKFTQFALYNLANHLLWFSHFPGVAQFMPADKEPCPIDVCFFGVYAEVQVSDALAKLGIHFYETGNVCTDTEGRCG